MTITSALVITTFHRDLFNAQVAGMKATGTMQAKLAALIASKYTVAPTFEQYRADQAALAEIAKEKGLKDNQWVRKPYALAVKAAFGALPVSQDPAAIAKRKARGPAKEKAATVPKRGAEDLEALIARVGVFKVLEACTRILEADDSTKSQAKGIAAAMLKKAA